MMMPGRKYSSASGYRYGFNGKENDNAISADNIDFGARIYNGRIGRWLSVDPLQAKYPNLSPYNFVANSPLSNIDPDGRLIIFINGLRLKQGGRDQDKRKLWRKARSGIYHRDNLLQSYWKTDKNSFGRKVDIAESFMKLIGDDKDYYISGSSQWTSQADQRIAEGRMKAIDFHKMVQAKIIKIDQGETIKIISHSQGGAHSVGFAEQLMSYKDANGDPLYKIEVMYYITPHQPTQFSHPAGIRGVQYSHPNDAISSDDPGWLPNGGSEFGRINGITEFDDRDIMFKHNGRGVVPPGLPNKKGQVVSTGASGNRGGHNVEDNDFIFRIPRIDPGGVRRREDNPFLQKQNTNAGRQ